MLASSSAVTYVDLGGNPIGDEGAEALPFLVSQVTTSKSNPYGSACELMASSEEWFNDSQHTSCIRQHTWIPPYSVQRPRSSLKKHACCTR